MPVELLAVGDMHLGRTPVGLPGVSAAELRACSPAAAWRATVDEALRRNVDALLLLGDVVDHDRDFFEAYALLQEGVKRLRQAGIEVVAVVGNHDVEVLPRLADEIGGLRLLGRGGRWEELVIAGRSGGSARLVGWSFPRRQVSHDPTADFALSSSALPTIGMLHGDLDARTSDYAPLQRARLAGLGCSAWLLGHIHKPTLQGARDRIGYLGSLVGLDAGPGELGLHGPWSVRVAAAGVELEQLPLAPLRWETLPLELDESSGPESVQGALTRGLDRFAGDASRRWGESRFVAVRLRVEGASAARREILAVLRERATGWRVELDGRAFVVESVVDATRPPVDLHALSRQRHPAAGLARRLLALSGADPAERARLLAAARERELALRSSRSFAGAPLPTPSDEELLAELHRAGHDLLDEMLAESRP